MALATSSTLSGMHCLKQTKLSGQTLLQATRTSSLLMTRAQGISVGFTFTRLDSGLGLGATSVTSVVSSRGTLRKD
eukprot:5702059-Ditylum_brightwellii.AAC.1